jgi:cytochrome c-type biogenesis protein CcmH
MRPLAKGVLLAGKSHYMGPMLANWQFWLVVGALVAAVAFVVLRVRPATGDKDEGTVGLYKAQLAEIDRDLARGTLAEAEAERMRLEVSRRLLDADKHQGTATVASGRTGLAAIVILMLGGAIAGYVWLGAPGYPDVPLADRIAAAEDLRAARPDQATAEAQANLPPPLTPDAEFAALMDRLRAAVANRPDDLTGLALLAQNEASLGNFAAARTAQEALIAAKGDNATADDHAALAEMMIAMAGGYVSPQAEDALTRALQIDPDHPTARYYAGLMMGQVGRYDLGFRMWQPLVDAPPEMPWMQAFLTQMPDMAARAGVEFETPLPSDFTPEDMVAQLSDRLATEGGPAEDWARLITSLLVLGETERAETIRVEALQVFGDSEKAMALIRGARAP